MWAPSSSWTSARSAACIWAGVHHRAGTPAARQHGSELTIEGIRRCSRRGDHQYGSGGLRGTRGPSPALSCGAAVCLGRRQHTADTGAEAGRDGSRGTRNMFLKPLASVQWWRRAIRLAYMVLEGGCRGMQAGSGMSCSSWASAASYQRPVVPASPQRFSGQQQSEDPALHGHPWQAAPARRVANSQVPSPAPVTRDPRGYASCS